MFVINFRIKVTTGLVGVVHVNGSCMSSSPIGKGAMINVVGDRQVLLPAEVIESVQTRRAADSFKWIMLS